MDIIGTAEMYDLLAELGTAFDRVIVDGPAFLGLADARVVGQFADGILFIVQSGSKDSRPLSRAHQLLEQDGLRPIGMVFNGLKDEHEDVARPRRANRPAGNRPERSPTQPTPPMAATA
jgi:Mrp family chromosome partitioning ATPase